MAIKELQTRIALKYDTYENWSKTDVAGKGANFVLLKGEIGICEVPSVNADTNTAPTVLFKVGDGTKKFSELPWASAKAADVYGWAKKSEAEFKTWLDTEAKFATDEEVEAVRSGLDSRITALEGKFTGDNDVQGQLDALDERLDIIEGEGEGSIAAVAAATLASAKTYAEGQAADVKTYVDGSFKTAIEEYADKAASTAKSGAEATAAAALTEYKEQMTTALGGKQDVIAENTYDAYGAAANVKTYVDGDFKTAIQTYADQAETDAVATAKTYTDTEVGKVDSNLTAHTSNKENPHEVTKAQIGLGNVDNKSVAEIKTEFTGSIADGNENFVTGDAVYDAIEAAKSAAASTAQSKVDALADGQVKTNTANIAANAGEISRVEGLVTAEAGAREDADKAIDERLKSVEAFFETAEGETLDGALDTLKEIQDYLNGEGEATGGMIGRVAALETGVENLGDRMDAAEEDIDALSAKDTELAGAIDTKLATETFNSWKNTHEEGHAKLATEITSEITSAINGEKALREAADSAINEKFGAEYSKDNTVASAIADAKAAGTGADAKATDAQNRLSVVEPKVATLQDIVDGYTAKGAIKTAIEAAQTAADNAQSEVDTLEGTVTTLRGEYDVTKELATANEAAIEALEGRVDSAESNIIAIQSIVSTGADSNDKLRSAITDLQTLTGDGGAIRSEIAAAKEAGDDAAAAVDALSKGQVATNKTDIETLNGKVTAIENDYVKASDLVSDLYIFNCGSSTTVTHVAPEN